MPRGGSSNQARGGNNHARRGRGANFRPTRLNNNVHDRLGARAIDEQQQRNRFRLRNITSAIAQAPQEARIREISKKFLKTYFGIFDQPGRANLETQYNHDAFFSYSATHPMPNIGRNLLLVPEPEQRVSLLLHNRANIARELAFFPPTEHLIQHMTCDIPYYVVSPMSVSMMQLVITGVFKDTSSENDPLKAFTRVFILKLVSMDSDNQPVYEIFNDMFMLQPPTPDQIKKYHTDPQINNRLSQAAGTGTSGSSKRELIKTIMDKTRMNEQGALMLLNDCGWDEAKSMQAFHTLHSKNEIPQSLFA